MAWYRRVHVIQQEVRHDAEKEAECPRGDGYSSDASVGGLSEFLRCMRESEDDGIKNNRYRDDREDDVYCEHEEVDRLNDGCVFREELSGTYDDAFLESPTDLP